MKEIKFIKGANWSSSYYTNKDNEIICASTGSVYIEKFLNQCGIEHQVLEYHPDLVYMKNGVECGIQSVYPDEFETFDDIPQWTYSKDNKKPLIQQLNEKELEEFNKYNNFDTSEL